MEFRNALANFRGKIAEMRENLVGSALLIPLIGQNRKAAETAADETLQRNAGCHPTTDGSGIPSGSTGRYPSRC